MTVTTNETNIGYVLEAKVKGFQNLAMPVIQIHWSLKVKTPEGTRQSSRVAIEKL